MESFKLLLLLGFRLEIFPGSFQIANSPCVGVNGTKKYIGGFDDLEIFNTTLTDAEITTNFDQADYDDSSFRSKFIDQNLIVHYTFESTLSNQVEIDATLIMDKDGNKNSALRVENDEVYSLGNPTINTANGVTFSFWLKPDNLSGSNIVFGKRSVCSWDDMFAINANGSTNQISLELKSTAGSSSGVSAAYTSNVWQKVTFTIDNANDSLYAYIDGVLQNSSAIKANSIPVNFTTNANLIIGDGVCNTTSAVRYDGGIDELYIYEQTLTPTQIADAYTNNDDEEVSWVVKEDFSSLDIFDTEILDAVERFDPSTTEIDTALYLDGYTSYNLGNTAIKTLSGNGYTFSFWINPDVASNGDQMLFSKRSECSWANMFAFRVNGGTNLVAAEFRTTAQKVKSLTVECTPGEWQQITYTVDLADNMIRGYKNGVKTDSSSIVGNEFVTNYSSANILIASDPCNVTKYTGGLDELKIYSLPLTDKEVEGKFHSEVVTGITIFENKEKLGIYPNPASEVVYTEEGQIKVLDMQGNVMIDVISEGELNVSSLEAGIYLVSQNGKSSKLIIE